MNNDTHSTDLADTYFTNVARQLILGISEGRRADGHVAFDLLMCVRQLVEAKYALPKSMKIVTEAATSSTMSSVTRTIVIYVLDDLNIFAYAPPTTTVATKTGRTVKHTGVGSLIMTPCNVIAMLVIKATEGQNLETNQPVHKLKVTQYGEFKAHSVKWHYIDKMVKHYRKSKSTK